MRLDITEEEARNEQGSLHLKGPAYDQTKPISGNYQVNPDDGTVDVEFDNVPVTASYTLTYIGSDGEESTLVDNSPFSSLQDDEKPPESDAPSSTPGP